MTLEDEVAALRAANEQLLADNTALPTEVARLQTLITTLETQLAALQAPKDPPHGIQPNKPRPDPTARQPRKKRDPVHNHGRPRATPTEVRTHAYDTCLHCTYSRRHPSGPPPRGPRFAPAPARSRHRVPSP